MELMRQRSEKLVLALSGTKEREEGSLQELWAAAGQGGKGTVTDPIRGPLRSHVHQSVESSRQLLVTVTMGGPLTLGLSFHRVKRKLCASSL